MKTISGRPSIAALLLGLLLLAPLSACRARAEPQAVVLQDPASTPTPCDKCGKDRPTPTPVRGTAVGQQAPDLNLSTLEGKTARLSDYRGQVVLLNFWASWCGPCRLEVPHLVAAYEKYKDRGFTVAAVNLGEPSERVEVFVTEFQITFPVLLDPAGQARRLYPIRGIPTSFLLDAEGIVRKVVIGAMDEETLVELVEPLLGC